MRVVHASLLVLGCGARTDLEIPSVDGSAGPDGGIDASCELRPIPDAACDALPPPPAAACAPLHLAYGTAESCALLHRSCVPVDVFGFAPFTCPLSMTPCANTGPAPQAVFALNRFGSGHVAALCDVTNLVDFFARARLAEYLGRSRTPRIAGVGTFPCESSSLGTYLGIDLPAGYVGDAQRLAADWDVLVVCGSGKNRVSETSYGPVQAEWAPTLRSFARDWGKGLFVAADYAANCAAPSDLYDALNAITEPAGIAFAVVDLGYSTMSVDAACVADYPP